mmetsp:Transcript_14749/g.41763  ORF Transcript_14749/g.41763 Transcript_14749/m.41763 type:complete len:447 (+) Transcript_14749:52-1392(+)
MAKRKQPSNDADVVVKSRKDDVAKQNSVKDSKSTDASKPKNKKAKPQHIADRAKSKNKRNDKKKGSSSIDDDAKNGSEDKVRKERPISTWSKSKKKRMRQIFAKQKRNSANDNNDPKHQEQKSSSKAGRRAQNQDEHNSDNKNIQNATPSSSSSSSKLQNSFKSRLSGSRFRILNEELYTTTSNESYARFQENPDLFEQYHEGFRHQVESWPVNPIDILVKWIVAQYKTASRATRTSTRSNGGSDDDSGDDVQPVTIADFGCGDAQLAKDLIACEKQQEMKQAFQVHSFDLVSNNELITACDMANVPLENKSVDICIFCLSLMGTNLADFIREAHRVLKDDGKVKIAEVRSRIEYSYSKKSNANKTKDNKGDDDVDQKKKDAADNNSSSQQGTVQEFIDILAKLGFACINNDRSNKMFLTLELKKNGKRPDKKLEFSARPCIYKRR